MSEVKNFFAVSDTDESLKSKSGGKFGLNHGFITKIEFTDKAGKDESAVNAVDIWVLIGDREYRRRLYETTGPLYGANNTKVNPGEEGYDALYYDDMVQKMAVIKHSLRAVGVTEQQINTLIATLDPTKAAEGMKKLTELVPAGFQKQPIDVFLEYQWEIQEGQDRTYPELPKNMKGGAFLSPEVKPVGKWTEIRNDEGLHYVDDSGNKHAFTRNQTYMESKKAIQQGVGASQDVLANAATPTTAQKSTW